MSAHAPLAPSFAPVWGNCSGAPHASRGRPNVPVLRTIQGNAAHWVMEQCAKNWRSTQIEADLLCSDLVGKVDPDGTVVTDEIAEGAQYVLDDLLHLAGRFGGYRYLLIEQRVAMTMIHPDNWGTLDLALYNPERKVLVVEDLKFGHRLVRAKDNLQLVDYVEGLVEAFAIPLDTTVHLRICQPFAYAPWGPTDEYVCTVADLVPLFQQLQEKARQYDTCPTLSAGKWCRDCPARIDCPAAREFTYLWGSICEMPYELDKMSLDDKAREADLLKEIGSVIKARREALEDDVKAQIASGAPCSVKAYQTVQGSPKWKEGQAGAIRAAFESLGVKVVNDQMYTPSQIKQRAPKDKADVVAAMIEAFAARKSSSQLVDVEDSIVSRAFGKTTQTGE